MASVANHRLRLYQETQKRVQNLQALTHIDQAINLSHDLNVSLDVLLEQVLSQLNADASAVILLDIDTKMLHQKAGLGFHTNLNFSFPLGEGAIGKAVADRKAVVYSDQTKSRCEHCPPG